MGTKVSIIGAGGLVGSCTAFALQHLPVPSEICLLDVQQELVQGQALDLLHGSPLLSDQRIRVGTYADVGDSDVVCITAGLRRQPNESRLDLIQRNTQLFLSILQECDRAGLASGAIVLVVSNPVDILTYLAASQLKLPSEQVIGLGTQLDTIRFRSLIAERLQRPVSQVQALILGEHGDSMVPIWSSATVAGLPLSQFPNWNDSVANAVFEQTKTSGATVIKLKGGAGFAVGVAIADVIEAILLDQRRVLPISSVQNGRCYGLRDVALSVPAVIGRSGVCEQLEIGLWPKEINGLRNGARALQQTWSQLAAVR